MGCFSWMFCNRDNEKRLRIGKLGYLYCPDGSILKEPEYEGYGRFAGQDVYDLVANWNREYLATHPDFLIPQGHIRCPKPDGSIFVQPDMKVSDFDWYPAYADLSLRPDEVVERMKKLPHRAGFEYRWIGIDIACYNEQNAALPYPIKISSSSKLKYEDLPASKRDPDQGF